MNYDNSLVVTITVTWYSWAPSSGDHLFTCGAISRPPHHLETWSQSGNVSQDPFFRVSVSNVSGLVSVSMDFGLGLELLVSRLCMSYIL